MNKFCWFALGTFVGGLGTKLFIDHSDEIDIWFDEKFGIESPSKMVGLSTDRIKEGIDNAFYKNDIGGDSDRDRTKAYRIGLSNIIHKEGYASNDIQPSEDKDEGSEPVYVVNDSDNDMNLVDVDLSKIYKDVVITKEPKYGDLSDYIKIYESEYLSAKKGGLECILMAYSRMLNGFIKGDLNDNTDFVSDKDSDVYGIDKLVPYVGEKYATYAYHSCINGLTERFPIYIFNKKDNLYICLMY